MKKILSIICPIYNSEDTISKLIESLINQEFKDYELILVNDGSTDDTLSIIKNYQKKCENITVIDKKNTGVCDSRNVGIHAASGKYITFADSDDYYSDDFFEKIIPELKKDDFELLYYNAVFVKFNKASGFLVKPKKDFSFEEPNGLKKYLNGNFSKKIGQAPWNKIYVSKIIKENNILFEKEQKRGTELLFNMRYVSYISKYRYFNESLYYYVYDFKLFSQKKNKNIAIQENLKYYDHVIDYCKSSKMDNYMPYVGVFYLIRIPSIILAEANNLNYKSGKENLKKYFNNKKIKSSLKFVRLRFVPFRYLHLYFMYKLHLFQLLYLFTYQASKFMQKK